MTHTNRINTQRSFRLRVRTRNNIHCIIQTTKNIFENSKFFVNSNKLEREKNTLCRRRLRDTYDVNIIIREVNFDLFTSRLKTIEFFVYPILIVTPLDVILHVILLYNAYRTIKCVLVTVFIVISMRFIDLLIEPERVTTYFIVLGGHSRATRTNSANKKRS